MMDSPFSSLIALTTLWLLCTAPATAQTPSFGPLSTEEGGPLLRMSYTPMTESPDPVEVGTFAASLWSGFSNVFEQDSSATHWLFLDMERVLTAMTVRYGIAQNLEIGGRITLETNGGGVLDPAIVWWHTKLHLGNANRDRYAHDRYEQRLERGGQLLLDIDQGLLSLEDIRLFAKWRVISNDSGTGALSLRAVTRIPTNQNRVGAEAGDVAVMALARTPVGKWYMHAMVGVSSVRASPELRSVLRQANAFSMLGVERSLGASVAGLVQHTWTAPTMKGFDDREIDGPAGNLTLGLAGRWGDLWRWDVSFQEDLPADTPAADFTLGVSLSRLW
jgi:hypothetical protein